MWFRWAGKDERQLVKMSSQSEIEFETGHVWQAISHHVYGSTRGHVAIPTDQIDALTDEDIGRMVRQAVPYARLRVAVEMCEDGLAHWFRTPDEMVAFEQELQYVASLSILNSNERALIATGIEVIESAKEQLRKKLASKSCAAPIPGHI